MATLLLTSTLEVSKQLATKLTPLGHEVVMLPLLEITTINAPLPPANNILITSRYALDAAREYIGCPLFVVGMKTAELARQQGHTVQKIAFTINQLTLHLPDDILYLRGQDVSQELELEQVICYAATPATLPKNLPKHDASIILSARAAKQLPTTAQRILCLSHQVKLALSAENQAQAIVAEEPTEYELIELIKDWHTSS